MPLNVAGWAYVSIAVTVGWFFCWRCVNRQHHPLIARAALTWLAIGTATFFISSPIVFFPVAAVCLLGLAPKDAAQRLAYFCAVVPAAPVAILWSIPFPGINYLTSLSYSGLTSLVLLTPLAVRKSDGEKSPAKSQVPAVFVFGILYLMLCMALDFRETTVTNGLRHSIDHWLTFGLLLVAFRKLAGNPNVIKAVPVGLLIASTMLCLVGAVQAYTSWTFYDVISSELVASVRSHIAFMRGNTLRLPSTQDPIPFGVALGVSGSLICWSYYIAERKRIFTHALLFALSIVCISGTDSRGGLLALMATITVIVLYSKRLRSGRGFLMALGVIAVAIVLLFLDPMQYFMSVDQYGTFEYRVRVFEISMQAISYQPFFGSPNFHPILEQLRNYDGIIDIVNTYVQIPIRYGVVGLIFFAGAGIAAARSLLRSADVMAEVGDESAEFTYRALAAFSIGLLVAIATVSLLGILVHYYWVLVGFASACYAPVRALPNKSAFPTSSSARPGRSTKAAEAAR